ncbi:hypothetical protein BDY19DRAFT_472193 [Irpex rosettiformis]|uniref:Uncharacterized protein n=1 Tax=Irpex rosettiformis TaxID=378272 RepID=A0ACB8TSE7_9APHY|nr:hypothetical protein BDY19DRAFT_472193 [Irpex rosettiformis]
MMSGGALMTAMISSSVFNLVPSFYFTSVFPDGIRALVARKYQFLTMLTLAISFRIIGFSTSCNLPLFRYLNTSCYSFFSRLQELHSLCDFYMLLLDLLSDVQSPTLYLSRRAHYSRLLHVPFQCSNSILNLCLIQSTSCPSSRPSSPSYLFYT